ncbi:25S rRNA (adenine645-N1)-methyltransferase [Modicella reniformis]|uniref:Ribosomal RNA-processing protein 8 n=1 Tax=Modicella reniformis TaxID=1440133 RepID=A0A9P6MJZ9_9FUNG|nr:25S rRNA (adenine645-N1)-methyltransferase [Modicella reniformis]
MFAIPGFNVGTLVVEEPKEQLKKRKHDTVSIFTTTTTTKPKLLTTNINDSTTSAGISNNTKASTTKISSPSTTTLTSTSFAPPAKRFKKDLATTSSAIAAKASPASFLTSETVIPLKERDSWNRSTKTLRKAKDQEKDLAGLNTDKGRGKNKNSKTGQDEDVVMKEAPEQKQKRGRKKVEQASAPKKRNKRLERKIKKVAFITVIETKKEEDEKKPNDVTDKNGSLEAEQVNDINMTEKTEGSGERPKKKNEKTLQPKKILHPELAKLSSKEKRLLKQFQKKKQEEGIDLAAVASSDLLNGPSVNHNDKKALKKTREDSGITKSKNKKEKNKVVTTASIDPASSKETSKKVKKIDSEASKKQQNLAKEREKLLEALNRTNSALAELQKSLGEGEEEKTPMNKAEVKTALRSNKKEKGIKKEESKKGESGSNSETKSSSSSVVAATPTKSKLPKLTKLQEQMKKTLAGGKFRFLNEQLYTTTGEEAFELFQAKPELFDEYHEGFRSQVESWPHNPIDLFIAQLLQMPKDTVVADLGCGDAQISKELGKQHKVLSFDLVAKNDRVIACDIAHLPLEDASIDVAIFCLSLMGTDFLKFLKEAYRVLKPKGQLKIAEVISRFTDVDAFVAALKALGFELKQSDTSNKMFIMLDFIKPDPNATNNSKKGNKKKKGQEQPSVVDADMLDGSSLLKPCVYKKR